MKISVKTTDKNYKPIVIKRCIIACWILLGICLTIKLFGGNYFAILCTNERFIAVCDFVDRIIPLKIAIGCISSYISYSLFYLAVLNKKWFSKRELIIVLVSVPIFVIIRYFTSDSIGNVINLLCNILQLFIIPLFFEWKSRKYIIPILIFGNILNFVFQFICVITKNIGIKFISDSTLLSLIFLIDTYIMLALYYLYSISKGDKYMSWFLNYFFGKPIATLEKMKETRTKKIEKLQEEIKAIDEEIARQENEADK